MVKEFKEFILRGNVVDLAVAVVLGAAFIAIVNSVGERHLHADHRVRSRRSGLHQPVHRSRRRYLREPEGRAGCRRSDHQLRRIHHAIITFLLVALILFLHHQSDQQAAEAAGPGAGPTPRSARTVCRRSRWLPRAARVHVPTLKVKCTSETRQKPVSVRERVSGLGGWHGYAGRTRGYRENWRRNGMLPALYEQIAASRCQTPTWRWVYRKMPDTERRHAQTWEGKLREAGAPVPDYRPVGGPGLWAGWRGVRRGLCSAPIHVMVESIRQFMATATSRRREAAACRSRSDPCARLSRPGEKHPLVLEKGRSLVSEGRHTAALLACTALRRRSPGAT